MTGSSVYLGTSSFSSRDWIGSFYPKATKPSDFLSYYSKIFSTVEIDSTYYAVPSENSVKRWYDVTPESFLFSAKLPKSIVHAGEKSKPDPSKLLIPDFTYNIRDSFLQRMTLLNNKLDTILIQFPYLNKKLFPSPTPFFDRLEQFFQDLPKEFNYAVEIRNKYWLNTRFKAICRNSNIPTVLTDHAWMPHGDELTGRVIDVANGRAYIRLIGDRYEIEKITTVWDKEVVNMDERLLRWSSLIKKLRAQPIKILVYANNHYSGHAPATLKKLSLMTGIDLPSL